LRSICLYVFEKSFWINEFHKSYKINFQIFSNFKFSFLFVRETKYIANKYIIFIMEGVSIKKIENVLFCWVYVIIVYSVVS
jgi:hypothetical protein